MFAATVPARKQEAAREAGCRAKELEEVERALRCKCEFGLSPTYDMALNPRVRTLMLMRSRTVPASTRSEAGRSNKL